MRKEDLFSTLGLSEVESGAFCGEWLDCSDKELSSINPANEEILGKVRLARSKELEIVTSKAVEAFKKWRSVPAPRRGEVVRLFAEKLRKKKDYLGRLVSLEVGKILSEGLGEVQEMIDIADFAVGLSRQLYGLTIASERPRHRMFEQWIPLGPVGIITAFNFPAAVWSWNSMIAAVCGDPVVWKPSPLAPLTAIAITKIAEEVQKETSSPPIFNLIIGTVEEVGEPMVKDRRYPLISATGSVAMGRRVGTLVAQRLGRSLLELGGNNASIVTENADLDLALRAILFAAVGTSGQRCTTTRRLFLHKSIKDQFVDRLVKAYSSITIGDPLEEGVLMGPLITSDAVDKMAKALEIAEQQGGKIIYGGKTYIRPKGFFVEPTLVEAHNDMPITCEETFAPILYIFEYNNLEEAIRMHNSVPQGLSSAIFTLNIREAELFLSPEGSDCGIANVNTSTSGAEIGGAFGGEKDTGGGREAGSDAWKNYMRRQTCTINWADELPLAQGVKFDV